MHLQKILTFVGFAMCTSCANQTEPFHIERFYSLDENCSTEDPESEFFSANGYLDVAAGAPQFFVGVRITGAEDVVQQQVAIGGTTLEHANRDRPIVNQQIVTYRLSRSLGARPKPYVTNLAFSFTEKGTVWSPIQLISPQLGEQLFDGLTPSKTFDAEADFVDIWADVEFKGEFSSSKNKFSTGILTFPIRAFRSDPEACTAGYVRFPNADPCRYAGQATSQLSVPTPPSCCGAGIPGC